MHGCPLFASRLDGVAQQIRNPGFTELRGRRSAFSRGRVSPWVLCFNPLLWIERCAMKFWCLAISLHPLLRGTFLADVLAVLLGSGSCWWGWPHATALAASPGRACPAPRRLPSHLGNQTRPQPPHPEQVGAPSHSEKGPSPELGSRGWDLGVFPAGSPMPGAGAFACPSCRMAFSSRPLLQAHQERLCLGTPMDGGSRGDPGRARRLQDLQDPSVL